MYVFVSPSVCHSPVAFNWWRERSGKMLTASRVNSKCVHMRESSDRQHVDVS